MTKDHADNVGELVPEIDFLKEVGGISRMTAFRYDNGQHTPPLWPLLIDINGRRFRGRRQINEYKNALLTSAIRQQSDRIKVRRARGYRVTAE